MVPVHPRDRLLLGMSWQGSLLVDTALPFGLRSAPKLFSALADAVLWAMLCRGVPRASAIHYLDDFLLTGSETSCAESLDLALAVCSDLGMPVAEEKLEGPATRITFLGIVIDTELLQLSLPGEKLACLRALLAAWRQKRSATKRELLSLIGHLQHAASIVKPGRSFLRHLIDLASTVRKLHHHVHLRGPFRSDLTWWELFVERWNDLSLIAPALPPLSFVSDASGSWGRGAVGLPGRRGGFSGSGPLVGARSALQRRRWRLWCWRWLPGAHAGVAGSSGSSATTRRWSSQLTRVGERQAADASAAMPILLLRSPLRYLGGFPHSGCS